MTEIDKWYVVRAQATVGANIAYRVQLSLKAVLLN
jgi:hypothetical protein